MLCAHGGVEVQDREQGEDEGLDGPDEQTSKSFQTTATIKVTTIADRDVPQLPGPQGGDSESIRPPEKQVAEEPEGQGDRLGDLLHQVDEDVERAADRGNGWCT